LALLEPTAGPKFETWLADVKETCGVDLRTDVIDRLGHSFVVYDHPTHNAGAMLLQGVVVSLDPEDPPGLIATMSKLTKCIDDKVSNANIVPSRMTYRGQEVHYVGFDTPAPLAPACMVYKDRLYCAVYPQVLAAVVDFLQAPDHADHSLLVNGDFSRGRKILGGSTSITWSDPRPTFEGLYSILLPLATMGVGAAKGEGIDVSPASVPTLRAATQHMFGQVSAISSDERGRLWRCYGPLPVPLPSMGSADAIVPAAMLTSILLPSLSRARELSKRLVCASNLKGIGTTMKIAVMDDSKSGVPTIQSLLDSGAITAKMLECPSGGEANYIVVPYTAEQIDHSRPNQVWMYEPIDNHLDGGNILFADGTVRFVRGEEYERLIRSIGSND
jgi:prepilin-type processing-associated H-X9-DG protein